LHFRRLGIATRTVDLRSTWRRIFFQPAEPSGGAWVEQVSVSAGIQVYPACQADGPATVSAAARCSGGCPGSARADQFGSVQIAGNRSNAGLPAWVEPKNAKTCTPPARELEARVKHTKFRYDGNSCLKWQASNVVVSRRIDDSILPKKESAESPNKIDAIDALLQGIGAMLKTPPAAAAPQYQIHVFGGRR